MLQSPVPVLGLAAFSGTGKTTLLEKLLPRLRDAGVRIGMIKHTHHDFDIDQPGKDSYQLRKAGAGQMMIASGRRWALMVETPERSGDPSLQELIKRLDSTRLDLILVEGFKHETFPKIELHRPALGKPLLYPDDPGIVAFASDQPAPGDLPIPYLPLADAEAIAGFVLGWLDQQAPKARATAPRS